MLTINRLAGTVLRGKWEGSIVDRQRSMQGSGSTPVLKPRADKTRSPKLGCQRLQKEYQCPPNY